MKKSVLLLLFMTLVLTLVVSCGESVTTTDDAEISTESTQSTTAVTTEKPASEGLSFEVTRDQNGFTVTGLGMCLDKDLVIPATYNGYPVTGIADNAFKSCTGLKSVFIPDSVTSIGRNAFTGCNALEAITIPFVGAQKNGTSNTHFGYLFGAVSGEGRYDYNGANVDGNYTSVPRSLKTVVVTGGNCIEDDAFFVCAYLTSITLPDSVTSIGEDAFYYCSSLTSITVPDRVTSIGQYAFCGCSSLERVTIPDRVSTIGDCAFSSCSSLERVTIPERVSTIGNYAFSGCSNLESVTISSGVTSIGEGAFYGCKKITSVTIPSTVKSIGDSAFARCMMLQSVTIPEDIQLGADAFSAEGEIVIQGVSGISGPKKGDKEGFEKIFDGNIQTKLWCPQKDNAPIVVDLGDRKALKGITIVNANDNASFPDRTVTHFEIWASDDGENWGDSAALIYASGLHDSGNFSEVCHLFDHVITAKYVKIVIDGYESYQMSEIIFHEFYESEITFNKRNHF